MKNLFLTITLAMVCALGIYGCTDEINPAGDTVNNYYGDTPPEKCDGNVAPVLNYDGIFNLTVTEADQALLDDIGNPTAIPVGTKIATGVLPYTVSDAEGNIVTVTLVPWDETNLTVMAVNVEGGMRVAVTGFQDEDLGTELDVILRATDGCNTTDGVVTLVIGESTNPEPTPVEVVFTSGTNLEFFNAYVYGADLYAEAGEVGGDPEEGLNFTFNLLPGDYKCWVNGTKRDSSGNSEWLLSGGRFHYDVNGVDLSQDDHEVCDLNLCLKGTLRVHADGTCEFIPENEEGGIQVSVNLGNVPATHLYFSLGTISQTRGIIDSSEALPQPISIATAAMTGTFDVILNAEDTTGGWLDIGWDAWSLAGGSVKIGDLTIPLDQANWQVVVSPQTRIGNLQLKGQVSIDENGIVTRVGGPDASLTT